MHQNIRILLYSYCHFVVFFMFLLSPVSSGDMHWYFHAVVVFIGGNDGGGNSSNGSNVHFISHYPSRYCQLNIIITITSLNSTWLLNLYYILSAWMGSVFVCVWCVSCVWMWISMEKKVNIYVSSPPSPIQILWFYSLLFLHLLG